MRRDELVKDAYAEIALVREENERLRQWIKLLEAFLKLTTEHFQVSSVWGKAKKELLAKRKELMR